MGDDFNLEAGNVIKRFEKLKRNHAELQRSSAKEIAFLKEEADKAIKEKDLTLKKMKQLQNAVTKPLIEQVVVRENQIKSLKSQVEQVQKNLKILHAVIRTPVLVEKYAKQARKLETPSRKISQDLEAFMTLKQNNFDEEKADGFIKELSNSVHQCL